jgi:FixJ family two-component response regulator
MNNRRTKKIVNKDDHPLACILAEDKSDCWRYKRLIEKMGHQVSLCYHVSDVLIESRLHPISALFIILTDDLEVQFLDMQEWLSVNHEFVAPIVLISKKDHFSFAVQAMKLGVLDFLIEPISDELWIATVEKTIAEYLNRQDGLKDTQACLALLNHFTHRERQVFSALLEGQMGKKIADGLNIHLKTLDTHRTNILKKVNLSSVAELIHWVSKGKRLDLIENFYKRRLFTTF